MIVGTAGVVTILDVVLWRRGRPTVSMLCGEHLALVGAAMGALYLHFAWARLQRFLTRVL